MAVRVTTEDLYGTRTDASPQQQADLRLDVEVPKGTRLLRCKNLGDRWRIVVPVEGKRTELITFRNPLGKTTGERIGPTFPLLTKVTLKRSQCGVAKGAQGVILDIAALSTTPAGEVAQVLHVDCDAPTTEYTVKRTNGQQGVWSESGCEPCDPPADHDTTAGKEAAASVIRNSQMTEIKVGDVVEVVSESGGQTWMADVGSTGKVRCFELIDNIECVQLQNLPGKRNALGGYVSLCDVRKVPQ